MSFFMNLSNLELQRTLEIQEETLSKNLRRGNEENLGNLEENLRKKWHKFIKNFAEVFDKIPGNLEKSFRNCEENFKNFKVICEKMCGSFEKNLRKSRESLENCVEI